MTKHNIQAGQKFSHWTVIRQEGNYRGNARYLCRCDCGNISYVLGGYLVHGRSRSCVSCSKKKDAPYARTKLYGVWSAMRNRCNRRTDKNYRNYGGRGIKVCAEWNDFLTFQKWSIENGYREGVTIDRINNDGDYAPSNCRWVTQKIQANNTRNVHWITHNGETKTLSEWASVLGLTPQGLLGRLKKYSIEEAFSAPKNSRAGRYGLFGKRDDSSKQNNRRSL